MTVEEVAMAMAEEMDPVRPLAGYWLVKATTQPSFLWVRRCLFLVSIMHAAWHLFLSAFGKQTRFPLPMALETRI